MQGRPEGVVCLHAPDHSHLPCLDEVGALCISALLHHHCVVRQPLQLYHPCQVMQLPCCPAPVVHISAPGFYTTFLPHHAFLASCTSTHNSALYDSALQQVHVTGQLLATVTWPTAMAFVAVTVFMWPNNMPKSPWQVLSKLLPS